MPFSHSLIPILTIAILCLFPFTSSRSLSNNALGRRQATAPQAGDYYTRNLQTIRSIYDMTVYPNNLPIVMQGGAAVPPGLFDANATGRVSPVGDFEGFEDSIEYFFALAPVPQGNNASTAIYDSQVVDFVSGCPEVAASLVYLRTGSVDQMAGQVDKRKPTSTLSQVAFWRFNEQGAVQGYQAWIPNLQAWTRENTGIDYDSMQVQAAAAQGLCPVIQQRCTGANAQFDSVQDCAAQLGRKPFGNFDEAWGDNIACRTIHIILTQVRPDVHCPHVGPTGGGKCIDIEYSVDYFNDEELFGAPLGSVFTCGAPLQPDNQVGAGPGAAAILQGLAQAAAGGQSPGNMGGQAGAAAAVPGQMMTGAGAAPGQAGGVPQNPAEEAVPGRMAAAGGMPGSMPQAMPAQAMPQSHGHYGSGSSQANAQPQGHSAPSMAGAVPGQANAMPAMGQSSPQAPNEMVPGMMQGGSCVCPSYHSDPDGAMGAMPAEAKVMPNMPAQAAGGQGHHASHYGKLKA